MQDHTGPSQPAFDMVQATAHSAGDQESAGRVCAQSLRTTCPLAHRGNIYANTSYHTYFYLLLKRVPFFPYFARLHQPITCEERELMLN